MKKDKDLKNKDKEEFKKIEKQHDHFEENRTELDEFENQKFADDIPLEELKVEAEQEKDKRKTQDTSQSEQKYDADK